MNNGFPWHVVQQMPLATLWTEAEFTRQNINSVVSTHAILIHAAIADAIGGGGVLDKAIEELTDG